MRLLTLAIHKAAFDVMVTGEKPYEYRKPTKFIKDRLIGKDGAPMHYDGIKFVNGYGDNRPFFVARFRRFSITKNNSVNAFSNGLTVDVTKGDFVIHLGGIIEVGNLKEPTTVKFEHADRTVGAYEPQVSGHLDALKRARCQRFVSLDSAFKTIDAFAIPSLSPDQGEEYLKLKKYLLFMYGVNKSDLTDYKF